MAIGFWLLYPDRCDCGYGNVPLLGALVGGGVAFSFYFGEKKYPQTILVIYSLIVGFTYGMLTSTVENAAIYAGIGLFLGLFGRFIIGLLGYFNL